MKGQHLALEAIATFGLTLVATIGIVSLFGTVNDQIVESTQEYQGRMVADRVGIALQGLSSLHGEKVLSGSSQQMSAITGEEVGHIQLDLPDSLGGRDYRVALENQSGMQKVTVFSTGYSHSSNLTGLNRSRKVGGVADGGSVIVFKNEYGYVLRGGR